MTKTIFECDDFRIEEEESYYNIIPYKKDVRARLKEVDGREHYFGELIIPKESEP